MVYWVQPSAPASGRQECLSSHLPPQGPAPGKHLAHVCRGNKCGILSRAPFPSLPPGSHLWVCLAYCSLSERWISRDLVCLLLRHPRGPHLGGASAPRRRKRTRRPLLPSAGRTWRGSERWAGCGRAASLFFILTLLKTDKAAYPSQRLYSLQQDNSLSGFLNISFCYPHEYDLAGSESPFVGLFTPGL